MVLQAATGDGLSFDPFSFDEDGLAPPEVDIGRGEIAQALVVAGMVVVLDEGVNLHLFNGGQRIAQKHPRHARSLRSGARDLARRGSCACG